MGRQITCFLIDDDPDDQEIFTMALEELKMSIRCIAADSGVDALEKLKRDPLFLPDYIFIDLNMPRMTGRECLVEIKKIPRLAGVPFIIYSTSSESRDINETREPGTDYFLTKPYAVSILVNRLYEFFQKMKNHIPMEYQI